MSGLLKLRKAQRREAVITIASVSIIAILIVGFSAWELVRTHRNVLAAGRTRSSNLALVLEEQTRRTIQAIDFSLLLVSQSLREAPRTPSHDPAFTLKLHELLSSLPYVRALFVIGPDGFIIQDSDKGTPNVSLADRDYFRVQIADRGIGPYIGRPLKSRSTQIGSPWFLSVSRRITLDNGTFYGVAVAAVEPKYFARFYSKIDPGDRGNVSLIHDSGLVIARYPEHRNGVGISLADRKLFTTEIKRASAGTFVDFSKVDGLERIYAYRTVSPFPLIVGIGLSKEALLSVWRSQALAEAAATVAIVLFLIGTTIFGLRRRAYNLTVAERLQKMDQAEALGRITSTIVHDFNNLLTAIGGNLALVERRLPEDERTRKHLLAALGGIEQGGRMVSRLLAFVRQVDIEMREEDVCQRVRDCGELLCQAARPCELRLDMPDESLYAVFDRGEFDRMLMNLVINARDATKTSGRITISVEAITADAFDRRKWPGLASRAYVSCRIDDQGEGIPPDMLHRVFEPFFTTKPDGAGTGLGLNQVLGFAHRCGGEAYIESTVGVGTCITVLLPAVEHRQSRGERSGAATA